MSGEEPSFEVLWAELRLAELANRSFAPDAPAPPWVVIALGAAGKRSAVDVAVAVEDAGEDWAPLGRLVAMRGLLRLGAREHAARQVRALDALGAELGRKARRELEGEPGRATTDGCLEAERALAEGRVADARAALLAGLDAAAGPTAPLVWLEAVPLLAGLEAARGDTGAVLSVCDRFTERFPRSDVAATWLVGAALAALHDGDPARAEGLARSDDVPPEASRAARAILQHIELSSSERRIVPAAGSITVAPGVRPGLEGREVLRRLLGEPGLGARPTSLAGIRAELSRRERPTLRLILTEEKLATLLERDAVVLVAEERAVGTGFVRIARFEPRSGLLVVERFDQAGAALRSWDEQAGRSALHGLGALILLPDGARDLAELHDGRLEVLDACEEDVREAHAGRGRIAHLTEAALEACPDVPRAWQLRGEALVEQLRAGELETSRADGPVEKWYADARTRFATAEWAHQIYATCLDLWNASHEAAIAWADARALDENDYRNSLGLSSNRLRQGYEHSAFVLADEALSRAPEKQEAWVQVAATALETGRPHHADLAANAILEVDPDDAGALRVLGVTLERRGDLGEAVGLHERAAEHPADRGAGALRASLAWMRLGELERARERALEATQKSPGSPEGYRLAAMAFRALGETGDLLSVLEFGLSRVGPEEHLLEAYATALAECADAEERESRTERTVEIFGEQPDVLSTLAETLHDKGRPELSERLLDAAEASAGEALGPTWRRARLYAKAGRFAEAAALLEKLVERARNAYFVTLLDCARRKTGEAPSLDRLRQAEHDAHPALVWGVTHGVARALGDTRLAATLEERLFGLPADALIDAARFLVQHGMVEDAEALTALVTRHPRGEQADRDRRRVLHSVLHGRGEHGQATEVAVSLHAESEDLPVIDSELDSAFRTRNGAALARLASKRLEYVRRGASLDWGDGMRERALVAVAAHWAGQRGPFEDLMARHRAHPELLTVASAVLGEAEAR